MEETGVAQTEPLDFPDPKMNEIKKAINRGRWTKEEDEKLRKLVEIHGEIWDFIASHYPDRADAQCQHRWNKVVNPKIVKGQEMSEGNYKYYLKTSKKKEEKNQ